MVDIHCHIIPEVDDGAKSWDIATDMCRMAAGDGVDHIVATPHANDEYKYDRASHEEKLNRLREIAGDSLKLSLGCDFHFSYDNIQDLLHHPERYCIGNTRYLLVEFSDFSLPPNTDQTLKRIMSAGITPIITHPERNQILQRQPKQVLQWAEMGALVQVTANSMTGRWGPKAQSIAEMLAKHGALHVLATDAHGLQSRPPILSEARDAMAELVGDKAAQRMVDDNPRAIVEGKPLPA